MFFFTYVCGILKCTGISLFHFGLQFAICIVGFYIRGVGFIFKPCKYNLLSFVQMCEIEREGERVQILHT